MPAKVKVIRARDFLQMTPDDEVDYENSKQLLLEVAHARRPPADFDVLIDLRRVQLRMTTADIYYLAAELEKHRNTFKEKVGILVLPGDTFNLAEFFELCARNRGFNVQAFTNYEDAIHWLFVEDELSLNGVPS